ncbi:MAG: pre-peptidase C-terminal domain-containing protein, partial [Planctomycetia bacterium]
YTLSITGEALAGEGDLFEADDSVATAKEIGVNNIAQSRSLHTATDVDFARFEIAATSNVTIETDGLVGDTFLQLFAADGTTLIASNDDKDVGTFSLITRSGMNALQPGVYFARVRSFTNEVIPSYTLRVNATPIAPPTQSNFTISLRFAGLSASQQAVFNQAAARWSQVITGDLPNAVFQGTAVDDVLIDASAVPIDGAGKILGQAGPRETRSGSNLPIFGEMKFDSADLAELEANGSLQAVILHEMGHVLGIGTLWEDFNLVTGVGTNAPRYVGANGVAAFNFIGGAGTSVPVENNGGPGTADAHWEEDVLQNELMTGFIDLGSVPLSRLTAASLIDLGYVVNLAAADSFMLPPNLVAPNALVVEPVETTGGSPAGAFLLSSVRRRTTVDRSESTGHGSLAPADVDAVLAAAFSMALGDGWNAAPPTDDFDNRDLTAWSSVAETTFDHSIDEG